MIEQYHTSDLTLASYLRLKTKLVHIKRKENKVFFYFKKYEALEEDIEKFFAREGTIDALTYYDSVNALKASIHNVLK